MAGGAEHAATDGCGASRRYRSSDVPLGQPASANPGGVCRAVGEAVEKAGAGGFGGGGASKVSIPAGFIVAVGLIIIFGAGVLAAWFTRED